MKRRLASFVTTALLASIWLLAALSPKHHIIQMYPDTTSAPSATPRPSP